MRGTESNCFIKSSSSDDAQKIEQLPIFGELKLNISPPTALNEFQQQLLLNFIYIWRFHIDDPIAWQYPSPTFNTFVIAFLRLEAWDLEVVPDYQIGYSDLPTTQYGPTPKWKGPEGDVYWFHGCPIVLHGGIDTEASISGAILKATAFLHGLDQIKHSVRLIIISLHHIAFVQLSSTSVLCSPILPLITDIVTIQCSPGFRVLIYVLTSYCWKVPLARKERWEIIYPWRSLTWFFNH
jgi:hypothetical protein